MQKWYVVQVLSAHEKKVKRTIEEAKDRHGMSELISEVLVPLENVIEMKQGEQKIREKLLWPGYLFLKAELTDEVWPFIKEIAGVVDFLGGEKPNALSEKEVEEILSDLRKRKDEVVHRHLFEIGDSVKITDGVFVNFTGTVTEIFRDKGKLSVLVSIFGRDTRVDDLEFSQVENVAEHV